jgi:hypothetical protein
LNRRAQINQDLAAHYSATNRDAAAVKEIGRLQAQKETLDDAIGQVNAPGLKEYSDYYRNEYAPRFLQGASREVGRFNRNGYEGNRVSSEDVPGEFFKPNNVSEARQFNKLYGEDAGARQQMTDHALDDLRRTAVDPNTGQIKEGAVNKWLAKNERVLNEMPWIRDAVTILRSFNVAAILRADRPASSSNTGRNQLGADESALKPHVGHLPCRIPAAN